MKHSTKPQSPKPRRHRELFSSESPYSHKVQRDRTKYTRNIKHKNQSFND
jgi:hypothetical protein